MSEDNPQPQPQWMRILGAQATKQPIRTLTRHALEFGYCDLTAQGKVQLRLPGPGESSVPSAEMDALMPHFHLSPTNPLQGQALYFWVDEGALGQYTRTSETTGQQRRKLQDRTDDMARALRTQFHLTDDELQVRVLVPRHAIELGNGHQARAAVLIAVNGEDLPKNLLRQKIEPLLRTGQRAAINVPSTHKGQPLGARIHLPPSRALVAPHIVPTSSQGNEGSTAPVTAPTALVGIDHELAKVLRHVVSPFDYTELSSVKTGSLPVFDRNGHSKGEMGVNYDVPTPNRKYPITHVMSLQLHDPVIEKALSAARNEPQNSRLIKELRDQIDERLAPIQRYMEEKCEAPVECNPMMFGNPAIPPMLNILIDSNEQGDMMQEICRDLTHMRNEAHQMGSWSDGFNPKSVALASWQQYTRGEFITPDRLNDTALRDILQHKSNLPLLPVAISDGKAKFSFSAGQAEQMGDVAEPLNDKTCDFMDDVPPQVEGTHGLAIPLGRGFFNASMQDPNQVYDELLEPQLEAFTAAVNSKHPDMPLYWGFVPFEKHFDNLKRMLDPGAMSALVLMTDSEHQHVLLQEIRQEVLRDYNRLVRYPEGHGGEELDRRNPNGGLHR